MCVRDTKRKLLAGPLSVGGIEPTGGVVKYLKNRLFGGCQFHFLVMGFIFSERKLYF